MTIVADLPSSFVDEVAALVRERTGFVIGPSRRDALERSLLEAMLAARARDPVVYLADLVATPALMDDLAGRCTVGETYFFRDPEQLRLIEREILPSLASGDGARPIRIWCAGCATGEEPYTLAIVAARLGLAGRTRILATDISRPALSRARRARYGRWSLRGVAAELIATHFTPVPDGWELRPEFRNAVEFRYLNLAGESYPSPGSGVWGLDLIVCRNVLIYFDRDTVARVAARLVASLGAGGWLLLGPSDPPIVELAPCEVVVTEAGLAYRLRATAPEVSAPRRLVVAGPPPATPAADPAPPPVAPAPARSQAEEAAEAASHYAARDYEGAAKLAGHALSGDGSDPALWALLIRSHANCGELADAERSCAAALERCPMAAELHALQALLLNGERRHQAAAAAARRALYLDRHLVMAHLAYGAALAALRDAHRARCAFETAAGLLDAVAPDSVVPASDGESAGQLADLARVELRLLKTDATDG